MRAHRRAALTAAALLVLGTSQALADPHGSCGQVRADQAWQSGGLDVSVGQAVCVAAAGVWSHGPEAGGITPFHGPGGYIGKPDEPAIVPWPYARIGALLAKIGEDGIAFPVEAALCFTAQAEGELLLSMNDLPDGFDDNQGALRVAVEAAYTRGLGWLSQDTARRLDRCSR